MRDADVKAARRRRDAVMGCVNADVPIDVYIRVVPPGHCTGLCARPWSDPGRR
ncbi:hypothetical protein [Kribbella sp. NBC_00359]|uniref:hypothetical protein n=1 Tax=Kribbella sp. NBC_00359 TaxID=2975966 RepID=UPI002E246F0D